MTQKDHPFIRIMHAPPHPKKAKQKKEKEEKAVV